VQNFLVPFLLVQFRRNAIFPAKFDCLPIFSGSYEPEIRYALSQAGIYDPTGDQINNSVFYCKYGETNDVSLEKVCEVACYDGGDGKSDYCDNVGPVSMPALLSAMPS
jgi:hypothetical protein